MANEQLITVLKWTGIVFAAGLIGYFGKYLSKLILGKVHKKGPHGKNKEKPASHVKSKHHYKLEKKRMKLEKKR